MSQKCRKKVRDDMVNYYKRENSKGTSYQAKVRVKGYKPICKTFKLKSQAQAWAEPIEIAMKNGTYKEINELIETSSSANIKTMHDLITFFRTEVAPERYKDNAPKYDIMFDWWDNRFSYGEIGAEINSLKVKDINASIISDSLRLLKNEEIKKGKDNVCRRKANTINKYKMCLSAILKYAVNELEILEYNPCSKVKNLPKPKGNDRFLSIDEIKIFLEQCKNHSPMVYLFVLISLSTGGRYSEVLGIEVQNIDFENLQVQFLNTKNGENRAVPIDSDLAAMIQEYMNENNITFGKLFRTEREGANAPYIKGQIEDIKKKLDIPYFRIHDMRHTIASHIAMNGGTLLDIAEILGHKSLTMARRYSHLTKKHTAELLNRVTNKILPNV